MFCMFQNLNLAYLAIAVSFSVSLISILVAKGCFIVNQAEVVILERLGQFHKILHPGFHFIIPFFDVPRSYNWSFIIQDQYSKKFFRHFETGYRIDLRETLYEFPRQNVITKDNVMMEISTILYYQIINPRKAAYEIQDLPEALEKITQTKLRQVIGSLDLDESLVSRDFINAKLRESLDDCTESWGVKVTRVEVQEISPPNDIKVAMEKQMRAERDRRAVVLEAEGIKAAAILRAEGEMAAQIINAEGAAKSALLMAEADSQSQKVRAAAESESRKLIADGEAVFLSELLKTLSPEDAAKYSISLNYIKAFSKLSGSNGKTVVIPYEAAGMLGSVSAIKELLNK